MPIDLDEVIAQGREVRTTSGRIVQIAEAIRDGADGEPLHPDTIATLKAKVPAAKAAYTAASNAFEAAIGS